MLKKPLQVHTFLSSRLCFVYEGQFTEERVVVSSSLFFAKNCFLFREMQHRECRLENIKERT